MAKWLEKEWKKSTSRKAIRQRRNQMFNISVGKQMWDDIKADPNHPLHYTQKRQIRKYKLERPWRWLKNTWENITGIRKRRNAKLRNQIFYPNV